MYKKNLCSALSLVIMRTLPDVASIDEPPTAANNIKNAPKTRNGKNIIRKNIANGDLLLGFTALMFWYAIVTPAPPFLGVKVASWSRKARTPFVLLYEHLNSMV